jgi:chorismate synthase
VNTWGHKIKLSIFGESHGPAVGIVIGGLPAGIEIDDEGIAREMKRRAPGGKAYATARREADVPRIISGVANGATTGAPLACVIENTDQRSKDYSRILRPGHADWTAFLKYGGHADMMGGGHFSGRLTAPLVFAGAIAKQLLARRDVRIYGRIKRIGAIDDGIDLTGFDPFVAVEEEERLRTIARKEFSAAGDAEPLFLDAILSAKRSADSVGGIVEVVAFGVPGGLGEPFFDSAESRLSSLLFSVPAVKGVEFGGGFGITALNGSEANGSLRIRDGQIYNTTNNNGGILGGITNGMPLIVRVAVKPTASIGKEQDSVDPDAMEEVRFCVKGRHDPCIVPRAVPVIEGCAALGLLDLLLEHEMGVWE